MTVGDDDEPDDDDVIDLEESTSSGTRSGFLNGASRLAATRAALPFVATYFVKSDRFDLVPARVVAKANTARIAAPDIPSDEVLAALRLRVSVVAARELVEVVERLVRRANFRFQLVAEEHVGHLHGRLDVPRFIQERGKRTVPRRYPVIDVQRNNSTPENVLTAFAVRWQILEIGTCLDLTQLSARSPEAREAEDLRAALGRLAANAALRDAAPESSIVARRETIGGLLEVVDARLRAGHVSRPEPYEAVAVWVRAAMSGSVTADAGDLTAAFYGPEFDDKLFELWSISALADALTDMLGAPILRAPHLLQRQWGRPLFAWNAGSDQIELYFQAALSDLAGKPNRWRYTSTNNDLRGNPDIAARCTHVDGSSELIILDVKLRQRKAIGQELYKLLGYLENSGIPIRLGGLIFSSPEGYQTAKGPEHRMIEKDGGSGRIETVAVDPSDETGTKEAFAVLARLVLSGTGVATDTAETLVISGAGDDEASEEEQNATRAQALAVAQLESQAQRLAPEVLKNTSMNLLAMLEDTWTSLPPGLQRSITTAVHFGISAPDGADYSGPVLGLCAAPERLIRDTLAEPALAQVRNQKGCNPDRWTLGTLIHRLRDASGAPTAVASTSLRRHLDSAGVDLVDLARELSALDDLREHHRNVAAHGHLIEKAQWQVVYRLVLRTDAAILTQLVAVLNPKPTQAEGA